MKIFKMRQNEKKIIYYKKCLCCGNLGAYILRDDNIVFSDKDIFKSIADSCEPQNRVRVEWCEKCQMETKQEKVAWDYAEGHKGKVPK